MMHTVTHPSERDSLRDSLRDTTRDTTRDATHRTPRTAARGTGRPPGRPPLRALHVAVDEEWFGAAGGGATLGRAADAPGPIADPAPWRPFLVSLAVATLWHAATVIRLWLAID